MIKASGSLQDLRSGRYGKRKAERSWHCAEASVGSGGVADGESGSDRIGLINLVAKCAGARSAGNPHAACEVAGAGNGATDTAKRARRGKPRKQPSRRPDGPPRQFPTLHRVRTSDPPLRAPSGDLGARSARLPTGVQRSADGSLDGSVVRDRYVASLHHGPSVLPMGRTSQIGLFNRRMRLRCVLEGTVKVS